MTLHSKYAQFNWVYRAPKMRGGKAQRNPSTIPPPIALIFRVIEFETLCIGILGVGFVGSTWAAQRRMAWEDDHEYWWDYYLGWGSCVLRYAATSIRIACHWARKFVSGIFTICSVYSVVSNDLIDDDLNPEASAGNKIPVIPCV
jgi:hypothetical protein